MMFPAVVPCELGPVIPAGLLPATTAHCTGVGVAPLLNVVLHPVVSKLTAVAVPAVRVTGGWALMVQLACQTGEVRSIRPGDTSSVCGSGHTSTMMRPTGC
jgi:hypothetical protein